MVARGGDDLEDDYAPDELVAQSEDGDDDAMEPAPLEGEEDQFIADDDSYTPVDARLTASDRMGITHRPSDEAKREKKRKKRLKDNERKTKVSARPLQLSSICRMGGDFGNRSNALHSLMKGNLTIRRLLLPNPPPALLLC